MQTHLTRPPLQPIQRQPGSFGASRDIGPGRSLQVPGRSVAPSFNDPVQRAITHNFGVSPTLPHYSQHASPTPTSAYASSTQAMFASPHAPAYHPSSFDPKTMTHLSTRRRFPYRALMILLLVGVVAAGVYAGITAFSSKVPVNATTSTYDGARAP